MGILNALQIQVLNWFYGKVSVVRSQPCLLLLQLLSLVFNLLIVLQFLTEYENHRTKSDYEVLCASPPYPDSLCAYPIRTRWFPRTSCSSSSTRTIRSSIWVSPHMKYVSPFLMACLHL